MLEKINKLEEKLEEPRRTCGMTIFRGFKYNKWQPYLVKKINAVLDINLLPYIPNSDGDGANE